MLYCEYEREAIKRAENLKNNQTPYEKAFHYNLRNTGILLIPQKIVYIDDIIHPIYEKPIYYIVDFYIPSSNLIIEIDGGYHKSDRQRIKDFYREENILRQGYNVLRFDNNMVGKLNYKDLKVFIIEESRRCFLEDVKGIKYVWKA
jgi:very-short-patch-repair endonuclease